MFDVYTQQIAALGTPFFFEDAPDGNTNQELSLFVQPTVTETSVSHYRGWAIRPLLQSQAANAPGFLSGLVFKAQVPLAEVTATSNVQAVFQLQSAEDTTINEATVVSLGSSTIGRLGGLQGTSSPILSTIGTRPILTGLSGRIGTVSTFGALQFKG
jgi:hypothetical protein